MSRQELPLFTAAEFTFLVASTVVEADQFVQTLTTSAAAPANVFGFDVELTPSRAVLVQIASQHAHWLSRWVIVRERHQNRLDPTHHVTVRGYRRRRGVITAHIHVNEDYVRQGSSFFATGASITAETDLILRDIYS
ncbi:hypothetical protein PLEOSDRAFT_169994 [Pleurotus ostreatus PC15]|uniref:Uncharacterized protein n=1 Tax=Pleurotus ostreatus (strain PC15) TaxID=1137138 RepID=A0A067ND48_PLEO1|nr:hypothetical protein PLEOSDRAFT_169994 [Pleurotus ostreatus PC15]